MGGASRHREGLTNAQHRHPGNSAAALARVPWQAAGSAGSDAAAGPRTLDGMTVRTSLRAAASSPKAKGIAWGAVFYAVVEVLKLLIPLLEKQGN